VKPHTLMATRSDSEEIKTLGSHEYARLTVNNGSSHLQNPLCLFVFLKPVQFVEEELVRAR
jgi:hypothetical protein